MPVHIKISCRYNKCFPCHIISPFLCKNGIYRTSRLKEEGKVIKRTAFSCTFGVKCDSKPFFHCCLHIMDSKQCVQETTHSIAVVCLRFLYRIQKICKLPFTHHCPGIIKVLLHTKDASVENTVPIFFHPDDGSQLFHPVIYRVYCRDIKFK